MDIYEEILLMYTKENLTIGEIAGALQQDPTFIYRVVYGKCH